MDEDTTCANAGAKIMALVCSWKDWGSGVGTMLIHDQNTGRTAVRFTVAAAFRTARSLALDATLGNGSPFLRT